MAHAVLVMVVCEITMPAFFHRKYDDLPTVAAHGTIDLTAYDTPTNVPTGVRL